MNQNGDAQTKKRFFANEGLGFIADDFNDPLPAELIALFNCSDEPSK